MCVATLQLSMRLSCYLVNRKLSGRKPSKRLRSGKRNLKANPKLADPSYLRRQRALESARMLFDAELDGDFRTLIERWKTAEERVKGAEQIREGEVVVSSIFELRYAGRKLIEVLKLALDKDLLEDTDARKSALISLAEAAECCVKAKHDAIDSVMTFLTLYFKDARTRLNVRLIQKYFPNFLEQTSKIRSVQLKIAASRRDTATNREQIYEEIYTNDLPVLLDLFEKITASSDLVDAELKKETRKKIVSRIFNGVMFVFGLTGAIDIFVKYVFHHAG